MTLKIEQLNVSFDQQRIIHNLNLELKVDQIVAILGPSGCGKTTLLRTIAGLQTQDSGRILLSDEPIQDTLCEQRGIGMLFQRPVLFPFKDVLGNILLAYKSKRAWNMEHVYEVMNEMGLIGKEQQSIETLSGGEAQRVVLARTLLTNPKLLLLDEPLSALDPFLRIRMRTELKRLQRELGISFIHVTHGQDEALALADEVIVMNNAVIEQAGPAREVFNKPKTAFVAQFMGGHNVLQLPDGHIALRSDEMKITKSGEGKIDGRIVGVEYQGTHVVLTATVPDGQQVTGRMPDAEFLETPKDLGEVVGLNWEDRAAHSVSV